MSTRGDADLVVDASAAHPAEGRLNRGFTYHGTELDYFDHPYNTTRQNERAVELAVAFDWLADTFGVGLELGNVLGHYGIHGHRVVDRYEQGDGVENLDVFDITGRYDWIVSISTIEHVGRDHPPVDDRLALQAVHHLGRLLTGAGRMLITVPGGYHPTIDQHLSSMDTTRTATLIRDRDDWLQTERPCFLPYGDGSARSVWIGEW